MKRELIILGLLLSSALVSCNNNDAEVAVLQERLRQLEQGQNTSPSQGGGGNNQPPVIQQPKQTFGPGAGNNTQGSSDGYLTIRTNSANGKLTLRTNPDKNSSAITEIPNGTSGIYYFDRLKVGDYVWYKVDYYGSVGYLRGDYVNLQPVKSYDSQSGEILN